MKTFKGKTAIAVWASLLALLLASASAVASLPDSTVVQAGPKNRVSEFSETAPVLQLVAASQPLASHRACGALAYDLAAKSGRAKSLPHGRGSACEMAAGIHDAFIRFK